ncbi:hypothetical protein QG37_06121 [Candidozyma auris]|uniref:Uncharacterized protein n=1 Tax=Candidozyma auris TaxID=498019 RepID=A0A0L0NU42_CANAR|nr:hypothetical protein QG37_06121 [[Candida] auris]
MKRRNTASQEKYTKKSSVKAGIKGYFLEENLF